MILWKAGHDVSTDYSVTPPAKVPKPTFAGAVLGTVTRDERVMSDVWDLVTYARVWDGSKVTEYAVGVGYVGSYADVVVDATNAVKAAAAAWDAVVAAKKAVAAADADLDRLLTSAARVDRGKDVTVVRGRKVAKGTTGRVFWTGAGKFGSRVGIELASGDRVFTALSNVEVTDPASLVDLTFVTARKAAAMTALAAATDVLSATTLAAAA